MTREEILEAWRDVGEVLGYAGNAAVLIPTPLEAISWTKRAANGHRQNIAMVVSVVRFAPAPSTLDELVALAVCKAVAEAFEPEAES